MLAMPAIVEDALAVAEGAGPVQKPAAALADGALSSLFLLVLELVVLE